MGTGAHLTVPVSDPGHRKRKPTGLDARWILGLLLATYAGVAILSARHNSATFDEIILPAAGARGYATGDFDLVRLYHPRVTPYLYGLPVVATRPTYPPEEGQWEGRAAFRYGRELYFERGNDPEALVFRTRLVAVAMAAGLLLMVAAFLKRHYGWTAALLGAGSLALLPDLLAHGAISYNDVPAALTLFVAVWSLDRAVRAPSAGTATEAGLAAALALGTKYSAVALAPVAVVLVALEAVLRGRERRRYLLRTVALSYVGILALYLGLVVLYLGDPSLSAFREGLTFNLANASGGHDSPTWLLGHAHPGGHPLFFPIAFLVKTPVAFHLLMLLALVGFRGGGGGRGTLLGSPLRGPLVAMAVFGGLVLASRLQIGFRHALPLLPFLVVVMAVGLARFQEVGGRLRKGVVATLLAVQAVSVLSWYPNFLPYVSEYFPHRDRGHMLLADSSHDWGQGLLHLRSFMAREGVEAVYLSYFGSALPESYGIRYVPLPSFFELPARPAPTAEPPFVVVSATNLSGGYVDGAFRGLLDQPPFRVLGHTLFVYRTDDVVLPRGAP